MRFRNWTAEAAYLRRMATKCRLLADSLHGEKRAKLLGWAESMEKRAEKIGQRVNYKEMH